MANISDKFAKTSTSNNYAIATTVKTARAIGVSVLEAQDLSRFAPDTPVFFITYKKTIDPITNEAVVTDQISWKALVNVDNNTLTNLTVAPGYVDTGNDIGDFIECIPTSFWANSLVEGLLTSLAPDGTFKTGIVNTVALGNNVVTKEKLEKLHANSLFYSTGGGSGGAVISQAEVNPNFDAIDPQANGIVAVTGAGSYLRVVREGFYQLSAQMHQSDGNATGNFILWFGVSLDNGAGYLRHRSQDRPMGIGPGQLYSMPPMWLPANARINLTVYSGGNNIRIASSGLDFNNRYYVGPKLTVTEVR